MSKRKLFLFISLGVIAVLLITGYILHKKKKEHFIQTQEKRIGLYFKHNLKNYKSMQITKIKKNPMGGYFIDGYVNNDKRYDFSALISASDYHQFNGDISYDHYLERLFYYDDPKNELKPNEIIKKEHLNKKDYEEGPPLIWWL